MSSLRGHSYYRCSSVFRLNNVICPVPGFSCWSELNTATFNMTTPFFVTKSPKSVGIAILLTFLFGPLGLFYATVTGGLVMTFTPIFLFLLVIVGLFQDDWLLFGWSLGLLTIFALTFWLINIIWAVIGVNSYNREIEEDAKRQYDLWNRHQEVTLNELVSNVNQGFSNVRSDGQDKIQMKDKPNLQDWLKNNRGKTINDYFKQLGK